MPVTFTYSFANTVATIAGPAGVIILGNGAGNANEGIRVAHTEEKDTMVVGADGDIMHSLRASMAGRIEVHLLKTSPTNALLSAKYHAQRIGGATMWGQDVLTVGNTASGDNVVGSGMAFVKHSDLVYATEGNVNIWTFQGYVVPELGAGIPGLVVGQV